MYFFSQFKSKLNLELLKTQNFMIVLVTAFIMLTGNQSLFVHILENYPLSLKNLPFLLSLTGFFSVLSIIFLLLICHSRWTRWVLALFLIIASQAAYYMDYFGVIIDTVMIDNILQTNMAEISGLLSISLLVRTIVFGLIPAWLVIKYCPKAGHYTNEYKTKAKLIAGLLLLLILLVLPFGSGYASFIREHKITRFYANPTYTTYSALKYLIQQASIKEKPALQNIATDAIKIESSTRNKLIILVVGETARADRFSLNNYKRETNPLLAKQDVISLSNVTSCGTSTGVSVPCMFSSLGRSDYSKEKALSQQNVLDVLALHGVEILWRDTNSDSKGVAERIRYENFKTPTVNPVCQGECRDIGMLSGLDKYIKSKQHHDILIVLHQMGNHGPEYYRRYPKEFARFKPICMTGELRDCTQEEIDNSYDNAILYTDYFLSNVIDFLKQYDEEFETSMLYVSDHGESLGEHGIYLHAAPDLIAPIQQTHVPAIIWMGKNFYLNRQQLASFKDYPLSHDDLFCTLLITFGLDTKMCEARKSKFIKSIPSSLGSSENRSPPIHP